MKIIVDFLRPMMYAMGRYKNIWMRCTSDMPWMPEIGYFYSPSNVFRHTLAQGELIIYQKGSRSKAKARRKVSRASRRRNRG